MKRNSMLGVACALMTLAGCGNDSDKTSTPLRAGSELARSTPTTAPAARRPAEPEITVYSEDADAGKRFRANGRSWRSCGKTVFNRKTGDDLYGISLSGAGSCTGAVAVIKALSVQARRRAADGGVDCFPGYCRAEDDGQPIPTTVLGYRCDATDSGDVSILLYIVCRKGNRYVSAGAADDE